MRYVLLDANIIIGAFDSDDKSNENHQKAKQIVRTLAKDDSIKFAITPLIRYEVLRGLKNISVDTMQAILNDFENFEINQEIAVKSAEIFHKIPSSVNLDELQRKNYKHNFDIFHYVVSQVYALEFESYDSDIEKIRNFAQS